MPTTITGDKDNVTSFLVATIATASNTTPVHVTTTAPHLFGNGDVVNVVGVAGNAGALGYWKIAVTGANTFDLVGSTGSGAGTGGTATDLSLTPQFQAPSAGDALTSASVRTALIALADRTQFLMAPATDNRSLASVYSPTVQVPHLSNYRPAIDAIGDNTKWCHDRIGPKFLTTLDVDAGTLGLTLNTGTPTDFATFAISPDSVNVGDVVEGVFSTSATMQNFSATESTKLVTQLKISENGGAYTPIAFASQTIQSSQSGTTRIDLILPISIAFNRVIATQGQFQIRAYFTATVGASSAVVLNYDYAFNARAWRAA